MAKGFQDTAAVCSRIIGDAKSGHLSPVYLLMGEEPYYPEKACEAIIRYALQDEERDFNQTIYYGVDADVGAVMSDARSYPMMADRRLVVVKEAQSMKKYEDLAVYCQEPLDSTVLVILLHGANADKRKGLYKAVSKNGVVLESPEVKDYDIGKWIMSYYSERGLRIDYDAAALLGEYAGTDLSRIAVETDKMLKNLPEGTTVVRCADIEKNVGISKEYSIFELTKVLSYRDVPRALKIAARLATAPKFAIPQVTAMLFTHFNRILKYQAYLMRDPHPGNDQKAKILSVAPFFFREYDAAVINYPIGKTVSIISLLEEYDFKAKGGLDERTDDAQLMMELIAKILN